MSGSVDEPAAGGPQAPLRPSATAWAPLRNAVYRSLWLALLVSNIGTWMQTVGAQWLLVDEPGAATLVSVVQTATLLPALLLALPAGALADSLDRRRLLLSVQAYLVTVAGALAVLTALGEMPPALLLTLTFALGVGQTLTIPTWQALVPEIVPREQVASASALGAISVNVARSVGPALAGLLIARSGPAAVFAVNAVSYAVFAFVLLRWRPADDGDDGEAERFGPAVRAGGRYVRHSPVVRRILLRAALFVVPGSALWALLPLVASRRLGLGPGGYGVQLGALGVGAIAGALVLPRVRDRLSANRQLVAAGVLYGAGLAAVALLDNQWLILLALVGAGVAWVTVLSSITAAIQLFLPGWVRARGLSIYQIVFAGGQAAGALGWGVLADVAGLVPALLVAGAAMLAGAATVGLWPLREVGHLGRDPAVYWPSPELEVDLDPRAGPILVEATYTVPPENAAEFVAAMRAVRRSRMRTGATRWGLFRHGEAPDEYVEVYLVPTWDEHLRQHFGRLTVSDQAAEEAARALTLGAPRVSHLLPPDGIPSEDGPLQP